MQIKKLSVVGLVTVSMLSTVNVLGNAPKNQTYTIEYEYEYDGRVKSRTENGFKKVFEYDIMDQLTGVLDDKGNYLEKYTYDKAGNKEQAP